MQRRIYMLWPFLWLLLVWIYVVFPFSSTLEMDLDRSNQVFTVLLIFHAGLYVLCFWRLALIRRWYWFFVIAQNGLIVSMGLILTRANAIMVCIALYLALVGVFVSLWRERGAVAFIVVSSVASFLLGVTIRGGWIAFHHAAIYVIPVVLVAVGYIMLSFRLTRANEQAGVLLRELETAHSALAHYTERVEELTRASERQRLARELHDTLAQGLAGLTMQLDAADALLSEDNVREAQEIVQQAMVRSRATLASAREAIDDLHNPDPDTRACYEIVQQEIHHFTTTTSITCYADLTALEAISPLFHEHVLRVVTEGLWNVARHAHAHQVWIHTIQQEDMLTIEIRDDGIGFDASHAAMHPGHYGLSGLRERAYLIGGRLEVESASGVGTTIRFTLPCQDEGRQCDVETGEQPITSLIQRKIHYA